MISYIKPEGYFYSILQPYHGHRPKDPKAQPATNPRHNRPLMSSNQLQAPATRLNDGMRNHNHMFSSLSPLHTPTARLFFIALAQQCPLGILPKKHKQEAIIMICAMVKAWYAVML